MSIVIVWPLSSLHTSLIYLPFSKCFFVHKGNIHLSLGVNYIARDAHERPENLTYSESKYSVESVSGKYLENGLSDQHGDFSSEFVIENLTTLFFCTWWPFGDLQLRFSRNALHDHFFKTRMIRFMLKLVTKCVWLLFLLPFSFALHVMEVSQLEYFQHVQFSNRCITTSHLTYQMSI